MGLRNQVARGFGGPNLATTVLNLSLSAMTVHAPLATAAAITLAAALVHLRLGPRTA